MNSLLYTSFFRLFITVKLVIYCNFVLICVCVLCNFTQYILIANTAISTESQRNAVLIIDSCFFQILRTFCFTFNLKSQISTCSRSIFIKRSKLCM